MLKNYHRLPKKLEDYFKEITFWPEITFDKEDKENLTQIENVSIVNDHSIQLAIDGGNHTILPSQYILYAIFVKEFALEVKKYIDVFELKKKKHSQNEIGEFISNGSLNYNELDIDSYSKRIGPTIFENTQLNLGAKSIVNRNQDNYKLRGSVDFFGSIILKPINIPNASSSILGKFIYNLTEKIDIYDYFERKFIKKLQFIVKEKVLKDFCFDVVSFLYNYDSLERIIPLITKNNSNSFSSIRDDKFSLTTIFKTAGNVLSEEDLSQGSSLRFFVDPIFYLDNEFYYFSTEWTNDGTGRLDLQSLILLINNYYPEFIIYKEKGTHIFASTPKEIISTFKDAKNTIYYGAPGTGKSHAIKERLKNTDGEHYKRITFHPDMDYSSFVGGYKPYTDEKDEGKIKYKFVPQVFIDLYVKAWSNPDENFYLVIEEINRGNCAEIFGDIFQLLDRNSEYNIEPSTELREYLKAIEQAKSVELLFEGKLQMPERLSILASMNTSDQSLYPMDSAFKRRWDWEYIAIDTKCKNSNFIIEISDDHKYSWLKFLEAVNKKIYDVNKSEDKQVGNWFINASKTDNIINKTTFINKVVFYLWNDVFKDEVFHSDNIFVLHDSEKKKKGNISFNDFFDIDKQDELLINLIESVLGVENNIEDESSVDAQDE